VENQHRKISGYRELNQEEVDLMNRIKAKGVELLQLQAELANHLLDQRQKKAIASENGQQAAVHEFVRFSRAEPERWAAIGKTDIQTGIMALVRAVAQPDEA
jgi:hypothetical protein